MANYESEHTRFIREYLEKHPEERAEQKAGRALWWDKAPLSADERERLAKARVAQKPYYYDAN
jgi:hypothetical protein